MSQESELWLCPNCGAYHGVPPLEHLKPGTPCDHDPKRPCKLCGWPVGPLSTDGPEVCSFCANGFKRFPPPEPEEEDEPES